MKDANSEGQNMRGQARRRQVAAQFLKFRRLTSPVMLMTIVWSISLVTYTIASSLGEDFTYFHLLVTQERLIDDSTYMSFVWLSISFLAFISGTFFLRSMVRHSRALRFSNIDEAKAIKVLVVAFFVTLMVALLWLGGAIAQFGGITNLATLAASDNAMAREVVLSASFPGGRLISSGFVGIAVYAATLLAGGSIGKGGTFYRRRMIGIIFILSMSYLAISPILVSGRINFFVAMIASFISATYASQRLIGVKFIIIGVILLAVVWTAKQYFTLGHIAEDVSVADQSIQGIIFYFYNDILNVLNTIGKLDGYHTYGWYSIRFLFFFTFTNKQFLPFIADGRDQIAYYVSAGEIPLLGAPFVDFGIAGVFFLFLFGILVQYSYLNSAKFTPHIAIYGILCACLVLSVHSCFITSQEIVYSVILVRFLAWLSKPLPRKRILNSFSAFYGRQSQ
jgi:oligosaccharide repeat unit polymerase